MSVRRTHRIAALCISALSFITACSSDSSVSPLQPRAVAHDESEGRGVFQRYVAVGTSVSMGFQSDGLVAATQATSWPAILSAMAGRELMQPYIDGTGCRSPLIAPLATGRRLSGESAGADASTLSCAALRDDVALPAANVAIAAALTRDVLFTTPENITDPGYVNLYKRVLLPGETQLTTMMAQNPKLVSIELGANEVLNARSGIAIPGISMFPVAAWQPLYNMVLDSVSKVTKMAVLVGLIDDVRHFPAFRRGEELWANRAEFAAFNVAVSADCEASENLLFVPVRVPVAVGTAAAYARAGAGSYTLSCAAGSATTQDYLLTPAEVDVVNAQMRAMTAHIRSEAERRGFAYFALGDLYDRSDVKGEYSVAAQMLSPMPYGAYVSLDGLHPTAAGARILAEAAALALNDTYRLGIGQ
jgi:hypothetical protein